MSSNDRIWLESRNEKGELWVIPVDKESFFLGRDNEADLILSGSTISRRHAEIRRTPRGFALEDLGSLNGTFINRRKIKESRFLRIGDIISIGQHDLTVCDHDTTRDEADGTLLMKSSPGEAGAKDSADIYGLTDREKEVLFHLLRGKTIPETAQTLCVAIGTVKNHANHIYKKAGCHSRMDLLQKFPDLV